MSTLSKAFIKLPDAETVGVNNLVSYEYWLMMIMKMFRLKRFSRPNMCWMQILIFHLYQH